MRMLQCYHDISLLQIARAWGGADCPSAQDAFVAVIRLRSRRQATWACKGMLKSQQPLAVTVCQLQWQGRGKLALGVMAGQLWDTRQVLHAHARRLAASNMDPQLKHWDLMATTSAHSDAPIGYADSLRVLFLSFCPALDSMDTCSSPAHRLGTIEFTSPAVLPMDVGSLTSCKRQARASCGADMNAVH